MNDIIQYTPALQIIITLLGALISIFSFNKSLSWWVATITAITCLSLSLYTMLNIQDTLFYNFGGWAAPIGIEYKLDKLNQPIIVLLNIILVFFLIFGRELINKTIIKYIKEANQHLFYALLLLAHLGYLGVISTNDLFNLYVFIEISSLATYILMSKGKNPKALVGAINYLILGTIGATLILIAIGLLLGLTGSLNITDITKILAQQLLSSVTITAIAFFLTGILLKLALFPMHFWMIRSYSSVAPFILTYLASISGIMGVYILLRFMYSTINDLALSEYIMNLFKIPSLITIIICTLLALRADTLKKLVIYSAAAQIGYIFLLISIFSAHNLLFQMIFLDTINKIALFTIIAHIQYQTDNLKLTSFCSIENNKFFKILIGLAIIFSASLPVTSTFFIKVHIWDILYSQGLNLEFITIIICSACALLYHFNFAKAIFFSPKSNGTISIDTNLYGLTAVIIVQIITVFYIKDIANFVGHMESSLINQ